MNRRKFLGLAGGATLGLGAAAYLLSDTRNATRSLVQSTESSKIKWQPDEHEILYLASLAPSGHNAQPWFVKYVEPYHWMLCNDKSRWLAAVDPNQRETLLSIGAFLQNLEYAAGNLGYFCQATMVAQSNQDETVVDIKLNLSGSMPTFDSRKIKQRRIVRSGYLSEALKKEDLADLVGGETDYIHYIPKTSKDYQLLNEQTIEANRIQSFREAAQLELADWIRFSTQDAETYCDGLTPASMDIGGVSGWVVRNFYGKESVMKTAFRDQAVSNAKAQVAASAGWLVMSSKDDSVNSLIETGKRFQRLSLKTREKNIAVHPMSQMLEEAPMRQTLNAAIGISDPIQFLLRVGYVKDYPEPVSLRRPVERFVRT